ncbi:MAG TPA: flagellar protein [Selenomonadales bacterium]|nr:flagellar protein [Selenomonadales bacterium]
MSIINCGYCKALCLDNPHKLCPSCLKKALDAEETVAGYLRDHENATLDEVHAATRVDKDIILKMIREGRIIEGKLSYACESCGAPITSGRLCRFCLEDVLETAKPPEKENPEEKKTREHFYTKDW